MKLVSINRILQHFFRRLLLLLLACAALAALSFGFRRSRAEERALEQVGSESTDTLQEQSPIRVLTVDLRPNATQAEASREEREERIRQIAAIFRQRQVDLVFVQGLDFRHPRSHGLDEAALLIKESGYPVAWRQRMLDSGIPPLRSLQSGRVLLSRFPLKDVRRLPLPPRSQLEQLLSQDSSALIATVELRPGREILFCGVEYWPGDPDLQVQASDQLLELQRQQDLPMLLAGEFHDAPPGVPGSDISLSGQNSIELLVSFGEFTRQPARGQVTPRHFTRPAAAPRRCSSWILADKNWRYTRHEVLRDWRESDSLPIIATLQLRRL